MNNLVKFVPGHLTSSEELISNLGTLNELDDSHVFISLDVVSLYPSVPLELALQEVDKFACEHWQSKDNLGLSPEDFGKCLKFVTYNYEITYNDKVYLQVGGVPMGTHYAPPFAVIFMNFIESVALEDLKNKNINPLIYKRYIDDIIMGPFPVDSDFDNILNAFNNSNEKVKFTIEVPQKALNFLDMSIWIENKKAQYKYYTKELGSDNCLNKNCWLPRRIKSNFVDNSIKTAENRCSTEELKLEAAEKVKKKLKKNGYNNKDLSRINKRVKKNKETSPQDTCNFMIPFVSDSLNRKINSLINKYSLNVKVVNSSSKKLKDMFNPIKTRKHSNCDVCNILPNKYNCSVSNVVYEFACLKCGDKYIGKTCRSFKSQYLEHSRSIRNKDRKSALSDHVRVCECDDIADFDVKILEKARSAVDVALLEARCIRRRSPQLNRCHELCEW